VTPHELRELPDAEFFSYLDQLDRQVNVPVEVLTQAWSELERRRTRIETRMHQEAEASGMTLPQVEELKKCVRQILRVNHEDEV
jgi:transposase